LNKLDPNLVETFYRLCKASNKWVKWFPKGFKPDENKEELINTTGHYIFSYPQVFSMKQNLGRDVDIDVQKLIKKRIKEIT
jgi:hypothetical protein